MITRSQPKTGLRPWRPRRDSNPFVSEHDTLDLAPEHRRIEVHDQAEAKTSRTQVGQHLLPVRGHDLRDDLELDHDLILDDDIGVERTDELALVRGLHRHLAIKLETAHAELLAQRALVHGLELAGSDVFVDLDRRSVDRVRQVAMDQLRARVRDARGVRDLMAEVCVLDRCSVHGVAFPDSS